jgi:hypothetical protein
MPGFQQAIQGTYSTCFGPVKFDWKAENWDMETVQKTVLKKLNDQLGDKVKNWIHGFEFNIGPNNKNLKRSKQVLAYSRDMLNMQVKPVVPPEKPVEKPEVEGEGEGEGEGEEQKE